MKYLLDTCTVSDFVKGEAGTLAKVKTHKPSQFVISSVTRLEIQYGLFKNPEKAAKIDRILNDFLCLIATLPFDETDASFAARVRHQLYSAGTPIGSYDILIAGTALRHNLILVSANTKEFERVENLALENWRLRC